MRKINLLLMISFIFIEIFSISVTANTCPTQSNPSLNFLCGDLAASLVNSYDADGDLLTYTVAWRDNQVPIMSLNMPFEGSTTTTEDYSGYNNDGTLYGCTASTCWIYNGGYDGFGAFHLDGVNDRIQVPDSNNFNSKGLTIMAWMKLDALPTNHRTITFKRNQFHFTFKGQSQQMWFGTWEDSTYSDKVSWNPSQWYHVAVTFNDATDTVKMYVDGALDITDTTHTGTNDDSTYPLWIGYKADAGTYFDGYIDDVKVFNRELSAAQIYESYTNKYRLDRSETVPGELWTAETTVFDSDCSSATQLSNELLINPPVNCGTITTNTVLNQDLYSSESCFTIGANNTS